VKWCSLKSLFPNCRQNQCISHHNHGRQNNNDDVTCKDGMLARIAFPLFIVQATRDIDGKVIWLASRVVYHAFASLTERFWEITSSDLKDVSIAIH